MRKFFDLRLGKRFPDVKPSVTHKIINWWIDLIVIKRFCSVKVINKRMKDKPQTRRAHLAIHLFDKRLEFRIYKELSKLSNKKMQSNKNAKKMLE